MTVSNQIDLEQFFYFIQDEPYVTLKYSGIASYQHRGSIDIFCYNMSDLAKRIIKFGQSYLLKGFEISFKTYGKQKTDIHFGLNSDVVFSIILFQSIPHFNNVYVKPDYIYSIIENALPIYQEYNGSRYSIYIPSKVDTLIMKYIEYIENHEYKPDSEKYLSPILAATNTQRISFFDKVDIYVKRIPEDYEAVTTNLIFKKGLTVNRIKIFLKKMPWPINDLLIFMANKIYRMFNGNHRKTIS